MLTVIDTEKFAPNQSLIIPFLIQVPEDVTGTLLGGLRLMVLEGEQNISNEGDAADNRFMIDKYLAMDTAIRIDIESPDDSYDPGRLDGDKVIEMQFITLSNQMNLNFKLTNTAPAIQNIAGAYQVLDDDGNIMFEGELTPFNMAPKSRFDYLLPWGAETIEPGRYTFVFHADFSGHQQVIQEPIHIGTAQVEAVIENIDKAVIVQQTMPTWIWWLGGGLVLLLLVFIYLFIQMKKNNARTAGDDK